MTDRVPYKSLREIPNDQQRWESDRRRLGLEVNNTELPDNWDSISLGALWDKLNDPKQHGTPQSTVEAILYAVKERGLSALQEPETIERVACCDGAARAQVNARIDAMLKGNPS